MAVAPSFQSYKVISSEPFTKNGKLYITVEHPNTHNHRDVRWYSDAEFAKAYGKKNTSPTSATDLDGRKHFEGLRKARGFANGPILVIRNNTADDEEWLCRSCARFATNLGWYIASTDFVPADCPDHFALVPLTFDEFTDNDETLMRTTQALTNIILGKMDKGQFFSPSYFQRKEEKTQV